MNKNARPLGIVGPGALGSVLAASLVRKGHEVILLGRRGSRPLTAGGLTVIDARGNRRRYHHGLSQTTRPEKLSGCSAVFFCVKSGTTKKAAARLARHLAEDAIVIGLQNGLGHERAMRAAFGPRRTVIGSAYFAAQRMDRSVVSHNGGELIRLSRTAANRSAASAAEKILRGAGWTTEIMNSEQRLLWTKLAFNAATNPLGALCAATNGDLADVPALRHLMLAALKESFALARAAGHLVGDPRSAERLVRACRAMKHQRNSMLQDIEAGRPTERNAILGPLLRAGKRHGTPAPLLTRLNRLLERLERSLK